MCVHIPHKLYCKFSKVLIHINANTNISFFHKYARTHIQIHTHTHAHKHTCTMKNHISPALQVFANPVSNTHGGKFFPFLTCSKTQTAVLLLRSRLQVSPSPSPPPPFSISYFLSLSLWFVTLSVQSVCVSLRGSLHVHIDSVIVCCSELQYSCCSVCLSEVGFMRTSILTRVLELFTEDKCVLQ